MIFLGNKAYRGSISDYQVKFRIRIDYIDFGSIGNPILFSTQIYCIFYTICYNIVTNNGNRSSTDKVKRIIKIDNKNTLPSHWVITS
jgi:hypothetical protein